MSKKVTLKIDDAKRVATKSDGTKIPVIDSKFTILITPTQEDIKNGVPGDHANCMYCLSFRRMHGSELVWVARGVAYAELRNTKGQPELHRFILSDPAKLMIKDFDASKHVPAHSVVFAAPQGCRTLGNQTKLYRIRKARGDFQKPANKAYVTGKKHEPKDHTINPLELALRDPATGRFQFKQEH